MFPIYGNRDCNGDGKWEEQPPMTLNQRMDAVETALAEIVDIMTGGAEEAVKICGPRP